MKTAAEEKNVLSWRKWDERRSNAALVSSFILLFVAAFALAALTMRAAEADRWVLRTVEVRQSNLRLFSALQSAESAERGFLITADERYLRRFREAQLEIARRKDELLTRTVDDVEMQQQVQRMYGLIDERVQELHDTLQLLLDGRRDAVGAAVRARLQNDLTERAQAESNAIDRQQSALLEQRTRKASQDRWLVAGAIGVLLLVSGVLAFLVTRAQQELLSRARETARKLADEMREREITEHKLRQAHKMEALGQLTGGVAHDFNNMLAVIVGNLDILLRHLDEQDARTRRLASNALEGATRASALTHRLLAFSRLQPLAPKPIDVNKCVGDVAVILSRTLGETIAIETVLGAGVWSANVDRPQLESAILNLAVNARDAMPASGGKLTIETANTYLDHAYTEQYAEVKEGQYVLIAVTDTGRGMPPEVVAKAFEPFFTTKPPGAGTGLGLSQVHGFIKQSGGHISIYSEEGLGTTVKLYFPRYVGPVPDEATWHGGQQTRLSRDVTVLVVEDEQGVRQFVMDALRELGYQVLGAENAAAALSLLEAQPHISVLLTDVVMPGKNGRQLADELLQRRSGLKVLYMTGYTRNAIVHNGVLDSGTRLLTKPFTLKQLEAELQALLS